MNDIPKLTASDFSAFFEEVHKFTPFPWQLRLLDFVAENGCFPEALKLPTGAGKTSVIDIAAFALALEAERGFEKVRLSRRFALVVDRRVVVDQAYQRAVKLAEALKAAQADKKPTTWAVAERLRALSFKGYGPKAPRLPLQAVQMRGGIQRDKSWAHYPDQPMIIASTVDQVGSRLFFRGYGEGQGSLSIHAGLTGNDMTIFLDEVHLSEPFRQTLSSLQDNFQSTGNRWQFVEMSATPRSAEEPFELAEEDFKDELLKQRLEAPKPFSLETVSTPKSMSSALPKLAKAMAERALEMAKDDDMQVLAVIANRVLLAQLVAQQLHGRKDCKVALITGRMRPFDRDRVLSEDSRFLESGRERPASLKKPLIVVSTQCLEAGADLDFDGLVTQCASLSALRQRFGRVDRLGKKFAGGPPSKSVIFLSTADEAGDDPIYQQALIETWRFLESLEIKDMQSKVLDEALETWAVSERVKLKTRRQDAPVLTSGVMDLWAQTKPIPWTDPDVSLFLHGMEPSSPDVQVVWRADMTESDLKEQPEGCVQALECCPPSSGEALAIPLWVAESWLRKKGSSSESPEALTDVEAVAAAEVATSGELRPYLSWQGSQSVVSTESLKPGMTVVVPASYGGLHAVFRCWDADATKAVRDVAEPVFLARHSRAVLRFYKGRLGLAEKYREPKPEAGSETTLEDLYKEAFEEFCEVIEQWKPELEEEDAREQFLTVRGELNLKDSELLVIPVSAPYLCVRSKKPAGDESDSSTAGSSFISQKISLKAHLEGVREFAEGFCKVLGLATTLAKDIALAAHLHDLGKADPRFQCMLHEGDQLKQVEDPTLLAKSEIPSWQKARRKRAQELSGYPVGCRHEMLTLAFIEANETLVEQAHDPELVRHLVASHHGYCRPLPPAFRDPEDMRVEVSAALHDTWEGLAVQSRHGLSELHRGVAERFWRLLRRYGYHRLAWFETLLRLSDHRESDFETQSEYVDKVYNKLVAKEAQ